MARKPIPKKIRFEVFKRDSFTCQYCGAKAPDVVLQVDHIHPVADGGDNEVVNLITSCAPCNAGKGKTQLGDDTAIAKQHAQMAALQERREQLDMMMQWRSGLADINAEMVDRVSQHFNQATGCTLNDHGRAEVKKWLKKYSLDEILDAAETAVDQYVQYENERPTIESIEKAIAYTPRIANVRKLSESNPNLGAAFYVRGICRRRFSYVHEGYVIDLTVAVLDAGWPRDMVERIAKSARNWSQFRCQMEELLEDEDVG